MNTYERTAFFNENVTYTGGLLTKNRRMQNLSVQPTLSPKVAP